MVSHFSHVQLFVTPWIPLSMGFSRQEYWSGFPYPPPWDLPDSGIEPRSLALQADSLLFESPRKPNKSSTSKKKVLKKSLIFVRWSDESPLALMVCDFLCSWTDVFSPSDFPTLNKFCCYHSAWTPHFCGWTCGAWWLVSTPGWVCRSEEHTSELQSLQ